MTILKDIIIMSLLMTGAHLLETYTWDTELDMFPFIGGYIYGLYRMERDKP